MSMNVTGNMNLIVYPGNQYRGQSPLNYSQFYKGTESIQSYGSASVGGISAKDTVVKYEFNTTDADGNKIMDKMAKEETLQAMKDISSMYGDNVIVEFSGDGMAALADAKKGQWWNPTEEEKAERARKAEEFQKSIVQLPPRQVIPNIQTNDKLVKSLKGAGDDTVYAAYDIIDSYLLKRNVGDMSEEERQDMIAFGLESAKYLAENCMDEEHAALFMDAMENIAKYGMNGTVGENGKVTYNIEQGPLVGAPDNYVNESELLKNSNPDLYKRLNDLNSRIASGERGLGNEFIALHKEINSFLYGSAGKNGNQTYADEAVQHYKDWKDNTEKTKLPDTYKNVKYTDLQAFFDSLNGQGSLSKNWMTSSMNRLMKWLKA